LINDLIDFSIALLGWLRGGVILATVGACVSSRHHGFDRSEAAALLPVVYPIMKARDIPRIQRQSYWLGIHLWIIIPPSVIMILFGVMTQTPVDKLFVAGSYPESCWRS